MSTIVTRAGKGSPLTHNEVDANFNNLNNDKYQSGSSPSFAGTTLSSGNLTFSSTAQRITGDFSNATIANRLMFQSSTTNGNTAVEAISNGTGTVSAFTAYNNSDPTNAGFTQISGRSTESRLEAGIRGTGTYQPMTFHTGGSERVRIDTSGNVGIGTSSPVGRLTSDLTTGSTVTNTLTLNNGGGGAGNGAALNFYASNASQPFTGRINSLDDGNYGYHLVFSNKPPGSVGAGALTERMRIDSSGNVGIGGTASAAAKVEINGALPSSSNISRGYFGNGSIPSGTTTAAINFSSAFTTAAASFTLTDMIHFNATQPTLGAGSAATNIYGFAAQSSLAVATNTYGFYGNIASGSNRWNFYAAGTAQNYFAGDVGVGRTPAASTRLSIKGQNNGSGTFSVYVENSTPTEMFKIRDDGLFYTGVAGSSPYNATTANAANVEVDANGILRRSTSSLRYKSDVVNATHGLADVLKLRSVTYKGKNDGDTVFGGLIAEEVHDAGLTEFVAYDKEGRPDALHYGNMVALLVKAVQELTARVAELEAK